MKKRDIDIDVNDYYNMMSGRTKDELWRMPRYNNESYLPITGVGRPSTIKNDYSSRDIDVNEYYANMNNRTYEDLWNMPRYNDEYNLPITGQGRQAVVKKTQDTTSRMDVNRYVQDLHNKTKEELWEMPVYNNTQNQPITGAGRPSVIHTGRFKGKTWIDEQGKAITNEVKGSNSYRPEVKATNGNFKVNTGRSEKALGSAEERKVYMNNRFGIGISGTGNPVIDTLLGSFRTISGLESEWEMEEYREGGDNGGAHFFPTKTKNSRIVLETGVGTLSPLLTWHMLTMTGVIIKGFLTINLLSPTSGLPVKMWLVVNAFPVRYVAPEFNALSSEVAIERVEFIHNGIITL